MYLEIKDRAQCSIGLVSKVLCNYKDFGQVANLFSKRTGRLHMIEDGDIQYISSLVMEGHQLSMGSNRMHPLM